MCRSASTANAAAWYGRPNPHQTGPFTMQVGFGRRRLPLIAVRVRILQDSGTGLQ
jgi:hypothetical protein